MASIAHGKVWMVTTIMGVSASKASANLLALRLRGLLAINRSDHAELMVELLHRILKLPIQHIAIRHDDDAAEDRFTIVTAQFHQIMRRPEIVLVLPEPAL